MLHSVNDLRGFKIIATDGEIGDVEQFYFDDERWALRYIVVNTGRWLSGRQVLISPYSVVRVDRENSKLHVDLTRIEVEKSPEIDIRKPVSRRMEAAYSDHYGYPYYWDSPFLWGTEEYPASLPQQLLPMESSVADPSMSVVTEPARITLGDVHLRSTEQVSSYRIAATDGQIGYVEDFIAEDSSWVIRYLKIDTRIWLPGKKVLVSPQWISLIDWAQGKVHVNLSREGVRQSPEYDKSKLISRDYETQLYKHYRQSNYWSELQL